MEVAVTPETMFSNLKPYCVQLLDILRTHQKTAPYLPEMARFISISPSHLLQPCLDYTLLPLLLLLDMGVQCRTTKKGELQVGASDIRVLPISDSVAEGVVMCLEELLKKCHLGSVDQMVSVLKKLTQGALLLPSEASEEFREGIVRCFRALLTRLEPCQDMFCSCKQVAGSSPLLSRSDIYTNPIDLAEHGCCSKECLLTFLRSENASAAVGHWLSLLLQIAETEVARGLCGSGRLREEAYLTLRVLVAKVASADALAFFLPGIVSRFAKALHVSKSTISGPSGSAGSIHNAVRGLAEFIVLVMNDEANLDGLKESLLDTDNSFQNGSKSSQLVLEVFRSFPLNSQIQGTNLFEKNSNTACEFPIKLKAQKNNSCQSTGSFHVNRTKEWIVATSFRVDKLLSLTFPNICFHPSEKVRRSLVYGVRMLLSNCSKTLVQSKLMLLECLCILVSDDSEIVSAEAQEGLDSLFISIEKYFTENEIGEILDRLINSLPRVILGNEEAVASTHAQKLLVLMYHAGPELVISHLLCTSAKISHVLEVLTVCLSQNSLFAGPVERLIVSKPLSVGYLHSIAELKACTVLGNSHKRTVTSDSFVVSRVPPIQDIKLQNSSADYVLPRMPPWFSHFRSNKLYLALAGILRLIGLSVQAGNKSKLSLSVVTDNPLDYFRKFISSLRNKEYNKEDWKSWYARNGSGQLIRKASTVVCVLNEIIYGISDQPVNLYTKLFQKSWMCKEIKESHTKHSGSSVKSLWKVSTDNNVVDQVIDCVGSILHEYLASEVWDLPIDEKSFRLLQGVQQNLPLHFFHDVTMFHQVVIDGIGIFSICLGKKFKSCGFLHSSLYLLLQNLICSNYQIKSSSDCVLHILSTVLGHQTVGQLVMENADYIIDSLCRHLRHLDLNPHIPDVLAAILSYVGVAHEILPLLDEPMRLVSLELEVLSRHHHPNLTDPFLKAIGEITKASKFESFELPRLAELFYAEVASKLPEDKIKKNNKDGSTFSVNSFSSENERINCSINKLQFEHCEEMLIKLNEMKRYRRIVGSVGLSCLKAATPLLVSKKESECLIALDIVEGGTTALAKVEEAYKCEKETKEAIHKAIRLYFFQDFKEGDDITDNGDENQLLPVINKIWPYLILCIKTKTSVAVVRQCMKVLSSIVQLGGGDFFVRRFHRDGATIWNFLTTSPFCRKSLQSKKDESKLILPYRNTCLSSEDPMAESSSLKIQEATLNMIAEICTYNKSARAFEVVLKKVSSLVVGIACSSVVSLRDASLRALSGLASMDSDLIWLLLADIYYSQKNTDIPRSPSPELPEIKELLPTLSSSNEYLYLQYGGKSFGFNVDPSSVEFVFKRLGF